jgi:hypothetical protein
MATLTLPAEYHPNPANGHAAWNGSGPDVGHRVLGDGWHRVRAQLAKHGIVLSGVRTEEPMKDTTPHWHVAFFYRDDAQLYQVQRALLTQFPAGLRVRTGHPTKGGSLRFTAKQYDTLAHLEAGRFHRNTKLGAQVQLDIGTPKAAAGAQARSFASYVLKYVTKAVGVKLDGPELSDPATIIDSGPAAAVRRHRETYGIRSIEFFGIPKGAATCWDLLRQVRTLDADGKPLPVPPQIAALAAVCQRDKGEGMADYLASIGGLAVAPVSASLAVSPLKAATITRYRSTGSKCIGVELLGPQGAEHYVIKAGGKEIMREQAAEALLKAQEHGELGTVGQFGSAPEAERRGLVQIGTVETSRALQAAAAKADPDASHTVVAAAGSGKTHLLLQRAAYLVKRGVKPKDVVIATFTREAAATLRSRLPAALSAVQVGTMHGLSGHWLHAAGCEASGFDEVIALATRLGTRRYHVLLDEAQDLSPDQWAWARANAKTLYSVGDNRQAIYGWRNAKRGALLEQARATGRQLDMWSEGGVIDLPYNLRSSSAVVGLGNAIAAGSRPACAVRSGGAVERVKVATPRDEVAELLRWAHRATGSAAVLARTNAEVARIRAELVLAGLAAVPVMTIHSAKGQEWDSVALACGQRKPSDAEEEAREALYVAVTRAKTDLFITSIGQLPPILEDGIVKTTGRRP